MLLKILFSVQLLDLTVWMRNFHAWYCVSDLNVECRNVEKWISSLYRLVALITLKISEK